jgi:hypothetical protein
VLVNPNWSGVNHTYHQTYNPWETVPDEVVPALAALRAGGRRLIVDAISVTLRANCR